MRPKFKTNIFIFQSKANNLDETIFFGKITHHSDPEIRKMVVKSKFGNKNSTFHFGPLFTCY